ncbi:MAG: SRPBCC family protein [Cyclobacteriaceae bacterium]
MKKSTHRVFDHFQMPIIQLDTEIKAPLERCFDLSRSIDLHKISVSHTKEEAVGGVTSGLIGLNEIVTWQAKHFGIKQKLTTKITEFKRPDYFVDEMVKGAFSSFRHEHYFEWIEDSTLMRDIFYYTAPFGFIGRLFNSMVLQEYMRNLLSTRNNAIKEFAESDRWKKLLAS